MSNGRSKGFTLVEMIVAIVITASLGLAVYTTFSQGIRLWGRASKDRAEWKVDLLVEKMTGDLRNVFKDRQWVFKGASTELFFPSMVQDRIGGSSWAVPAYVRYAFDAKANVVIYERHPFENMSEGRSLSKMSSVVLEKVRTFELEYYSYDPKTKAYRWGVQWNKDCFPETVKITIEAEQMNRRKWVRMIPIPTENACPE